MNRNIKKVLESDERVEWKGVISRKILFLKFIGGFLGISFISFLFYFNNSLNSMGEEMSMSFINGRNLGILIFIAGLFLVLISFIVDYIKAYLITNKRLLVKSGLIGTDFNSIYFTQVRSVSVKVDLIDKIFSVGTISIDTGKIETIETISNGEKITKTKTYYDKLYHLDRPYEAYKYFQEALSDREEGLYSGRADRESNQK